MPIPMVNSPDIEVVRDQFEAWMEGATARAGMYRRGHENPYPPRTRKADAWENGWEVINHQLSFAGDEMRCRESPCH